MSGSSETRFFVCSGTPATVAVVGGVECVLQGHPVFAVVGAVSGVDGHIAAVAGLAVVAFVEDVVGFEGHAEGVIEKRLLELGVEPEVFRRFHEFDVLVAVAHPLHVYVEPCVQWQMDGVLKLYHHPRVVELLASAVIVDREPLLAQPPAL